MKKYLILILQIFVFAFLVESSEPAYAKNKKRNKNPQTQYVRDYDKSFRDKDNDKSFRYNDRDTRQNRDRHEAERFDYKYDDLRIAEKLTDRPEQLLYRTGYVSSYNKDLKIPNWVGWILTKEHTYGNNKRNGIKFQEDYDVSKPRATHYDYMQSGYDRGHMCPASDNKWSSDAMRETFLLTNICPQNHNLNSGDWNELEIACRTWARKWGKLYIVCGPILYNQQHKRIGKNKVTVPEAFFKVLLCLEGKPKGIGFVYQNVSGNQPIRAYTNSIDDIEKMTGINFFPNLDKRIEATVESKYNLNDWKTEREILNYRGK